MHTGTTISDLERMVRQAEIIDIFTKLAQAHAHEFEICRGCGNCAFECDCPKPDPRFDMEDDPARGAR